MICISETQKRAMQPWLPRARDCLMGASYVEFYADLPVKVDLTTPEAIEQANANLGKFDVVGLLHDLDGFTRDMQRALGVRLRIGHENKADRDRVAVRRANLFPDQLAAVERLCSPDRAVWEATRRLGNRTTRAPCKGKAKT